MADFMPISELFEGSRMVWRQRAVSVMAPGSTGWTKTETEMKMQVFGWSRSLRSGRSKWWLLTLALAALGLAAKVWATPSFGFIINEILAFGFAMDGISQHVQINKNPDGTVTPWQLQLQVQGDTDYYSQHLVLAPGATVGGTVTPASLLPRSSPGKSISTTLIARNARSGRSRVGSKLP